MLIVTIKTGDLTLKSSISPFDRTLEGYLEPSLLRDGGSIRIFL